MQINSLSPVKDIGSLGSGQLNGAGSSVAQATGSADFSSVLANLASQTASAVKTSEDMAIKGIQGQAPVQDVVQAVMHAQTSLQTAMAIRDKAVSAYQDLIRMPI
ncbi:MAG: flagellar hook-basal body complex protein FliE [Rhodomicrobium sp.]